jgi:hypothetical protein
MGLLQLVLQYSVPPAVIQVHMSWAHSMLDSSLGDGPAYPRPTGQKRRLRLIRLRHAMR